MRKIVLIATYFGTVPSYFNLWLKSAEHNSGIDFLFYSDCDTEKYEPLPKNVKFIKTSFNGLKERFQKHFDFPIVLETPYKFCDYKPAYGYVFWDDISQYDYWGHVDIDAILGDIEKFLPNDDYDKIYQFGHLCIYKNTEENNKRFMLEGGQYYKDVFTTSKITIFDELVGMQKKFDLLGIPTYKSRDFADITKRSHRLAITGIGLTDEEKKKINYDNQIFYYQDGRVFRDFFINGERHTEEFSYIHFSSRKMVDYTNGCDNFYVAIGGFYPKNGETSLEIIKRLNPLSPFKDWLVNVKFDIEAFKRKCHKLRLLIKERKWVK